jgi:hypothetical protein
VPARVGVVAVVETAARGSRVRPRVLEAAVRRPTAAAPNFYIMTCFLLRDHYCRQQVGEPPWPSCRDDRVDVIRATEARNIEVDAGWTPSQLSATHPEACRNAAAVPRGTLCVLQKRRRGESSGPAAFRRSASASGASSSPNHRTEQPPLATFAVTLVAYPEPSAALWQGPRTAHWSVRSTRATNSTNNTVQVRTADVAVRGHFYRSRARLRFTN